MYLKYRKKRIVINVFKNIEKEDCNKCIKNRQEDCNKCIFKNRRKRIVINVFKI
jgi:hypothetical protein